MDPKELKKLVKTCRELGVLNYKGPNFEFTLTHDAPVKLNKNTRKPQVSADDKFESDTLTDEQLLMWSSAPGGSAFGLEDEQGA